MSSSTAIAVTESPIGPVSMQSQNGILTRIEIGKGPAKAAGHCDLLEELRRQIGDYLSGDRKDFDIPAERMIPASTPWQMRIREAMLSLRWGDSLCYGDLAEQAGGHRRRHARAAGQACGANLLPLLVPCHRVLAHDGGLGGFGGGLAQKRFLLQLEGHGPH